MSGLLTGSSFKRQFPEIDTQNGGSSSLQGTVVAIYEIGCFFGAIFAFLFGERLGRRWSIILACLVLSVGAIIQATAYGIPQMIVGRTVAGPGNGLNTATIPVWHSELMKPTLRDRGLSIELATNIFGVMLFYWTGYGMSFVNNESQFRFPIAFQILFALVTILFMFFLPESPRWDHPVIIAELQEIEHALQNEREAASGTTFLALFMKCPQRFRRRTLLGIGGQFMQQLSGINLITYVRLFQDLRNSFGVILTVRRTGFNGVAYFLSSLPPIWLLDRLGRRKLMLFACAGQAMCMAIGPLTLYLIGTVANGSKSAGIGAIVMLFLFNFFFTVGLLAIPWLLPAEYAPLAIRTKSAALATASNWIFTFLVVEITPVSINSIKWKTYIYFAIFNAAFLPLIWFFYPETQNLSLEQVDKLFVGDKVLLHWKPSMGERQGSFALVARPSDE
ncbi:hypothetical protein W97_05731, partial [Coniosporium apollinis CBS 100218]